MPYLSFSQDYDLAVYPICVVSINFIHEWRDLQFKVDSERQIFEKLLMAILKENKKRKINKFLSDNYIYRDLVSSYSISSNFC